MKINLDDLLPKFREAPSDCIYSYADGCANVYYVTKDLVVYDPMKPEFSNTGEYSGGEPGEEAIDANQFAELTAILNNAANATADHLSNRPKGSGRLTFKTTGEVYVFGMRTESKKAIENKLLELMGRA